MKIKKIRRAVSHLFHPRFSNNHRPRILHPEGFLLLFVIGAIFVGALSVFEHNSQKTGFVLGYSSSITPTKVIDLTNKEREKQGLAPLVLNTTLSQAALAKAADMFQDQYWSHFAPDGKTPWDFMKESKYVYTVAGENLARDFMHTEDMMKAWMNSPTHKENIVNSKYKEIGIAVVDGELEGVETTLVVQMFGTRGIVSEQVTDVGASTKEKNKASIQKSNEDVNKEQNIPIVQVAYAQESQEEQRPTQAVLAESFQSMTQIEKPALLSPLHLSKAFFLAIIMLVLAVLIYDMIIIEKRKTVRFVGKNMAHIALFFVVFFLILFFQSGVIE